MNIANRLQKIKHETLALSYALKDPRTPWYSKAICILVVAYAVSPIDLIPDFIPVIGFLDDAILLPLGIYLAVRTIPSPVMAECREKARDWKTGLPRSWMGAALILALWIVGGFWVGKMIFHYLSP